MDRNRRVMAAEMLAATQNINTNKQNQLKITKETLISNFCCSCVRLLVHRFTFSMKIFALKMLSMKIFFQNLFVWHGNDLVFNSEFEKNSIINNNIKVAPCPPPPSTHTHIKSQRAKGFINGSQGKGIHIFYKTIKLV